MKMQPNNHICGCYYYLNYQRRYLPQVRLESHTTINPVAFTTELTQTFHNPNDDAIESLKYAFPLYDGVTVNGYSISYANKTLVGVVKQKDDAKQTFQAAVDRGETAGLLESLPAGVFGVTLGNVPAKAEIVVELTYAGELKHDASIDGLRYMLPTSIAPRYGSYPGELLHTNTAASKGMSITVDIDMGKSAIRRVQSPSHPIALSMGELSTAVKDTNNPPPFSPSQASAALTQGITELAGDFILQLLIDDISKPQAILEIHPTLPSQRAIMTTMVPKFVLESAHPEIVFIADQSGSMSGTKNTALVKALKVFLKSLPIGVRFNICAFGSRYEFLWPKSQAYNETNVNEALSFVSGLSAAYGGTEIFQPIQETFKRHLKDMPLEVMLLTDGEIWGEQQIFSFINEQIRDKKVDARVFALGIGQDVSHTLVEGVARAGNGFAQFVTQNEDTDQKVVRMLKGALYAHTKDYELEVHYADEDKMEDADDFEIVENVNDCLVIKDQPPAEKVPATEVKAKSFFDTSADLDKPTEKPQGASRYAHLPIIDEPKVLQAPSDIPPLFPFNRTTAYLLLGPDSAQKDVKSVTLRANCAQGPLELNVPIQGVQTGASIHQLAVRKAIQELEEGRGWLQSATVKVADQGTVAAKKQYESRFDEIVEREGVRLGEKFQVASKWTSFVAVEDHGNEADGNKDEQVCYQDLNRSPPLFGAPGLELKRNQLRELPQQSGGSGDRALYARMSRGHARQRVSGTFAAQAQLQQQQMQSQSQVPSSGGLFGQAQFGTQQAMRQRNTNAYQGSSGASFKMSAAPQASFAAPPPPPPSARGAPLLGGPAMPRLQQAAERRMSPASSTTAYGSAAASVGSSRFLRDVAAEEEVDEDEDMGFGLFDDGPGESARAPALAAPQVPISQADLKRYVDEMQEAACMPLADDDDLDPDLEVDRVAAPPSAMKKRKATAASKPNASASSLSGNTLHDLIDLQTFGGCWAWNEQLLSVIGVEANAIDKSKLGGEPEVVATALVVAYFESKLGAKRDVWEMVVVKARSWLMSRLGDAGKVNGVIGEAKKLV